jgi:sec-independent protein translocase protein TatA
MLGGLTGWHFLIILAIILLLFGAPKLPGLARSIGQSAKIFREEMKPQDKADDDGKATSVDSADASAKTGSADSTSSKP